MRRGVDVGERAERAQFVLAHGAVDQHDVGRCFGKRAERAPFLGPVHQMLGLEHQAPAARAQPRGGEGAYQSGRVLAHEVARPVEHEQDNSAIGGEPQRGQQGRPVDRHRHSERHRVRDYVHRRAVLGGKQLGAVLARRPDAVDRAEIVPPRFGQVRHLPHPIADAPRRLTDRQALLARQQEQAVGIEMDDGDVSGSRELRHVHGRAERAMDVEGLFDRMEIEPRAAAAQRRDRAARRRAEAVVVIRRPVERDLELPVAGRRRPYRMRVQAVAVLGRHLLDRRGERRVEQWHVEAGGGERRAPVGDVGVREGAAQQQQLDEGETVREQRAPAEQGGVERDGAREQHLHPVPALLGERRQRDLIVADHRVLVGEHAHRAEEAVQRVAREEARLQREEIALHVPAIFVALGQPDQVRLARADARQHARQPPGVGRERHAVVEQIERRGAVCLGVQRERVAPRGEIIALVGAHQGAGDEIERFRGNRELPVDHRDQQHRDALVPERADVRGDVRLERAGRRMRDEQRHLGAGREGKRLDLLRPCVRDRARRLLHAPRG